MAEGGALLRLELQKAREEKKKLRQKKLPPPSSPREAQHRRQEPTIFEGPLAMRSRFLRQWQKRYFCLRGNTLSCYASKGDLEPRREVNVQAVTSVDVEGETCLVLRWKGEQRLELRADSATDAYEWARALGRTLAEQPRTRDVDEHEIVTLVMTDDSVNEEKDEAVEDALDEPAEDPRPMTSKQRHELLEEDDDLVAAAKRKIAADDADVRRVFVTQRPSIDAASDSSSGESNDEAQDEAFNRYLKNFEKRVEESLRRSAEGKKPQATLLTDMKAPPLDGAQQEPPQLRKTTPSERRIRVDANDDVTKGFDDDDDSVDFGCSDAVFCRLGALSCRNDDDPSTEDDDDDDDDEGLDDDSSSSRERSNYPRPVSLFDCSASRPVSQEKATTPPLDDGSV